MTHRQRIETAWRFHEPDRVPIEVALSDAVRGHPRARRLAELVDEHADNFAIAPGPDWGFLGFPSEYHEEVIERAPGEYTRMRRVHKTVAGEFIALTYHPAGNPDYHWEKRFVSTLDDLARLADTPRPRTPWDREAYHEAVETIGESAYPLMVLLHPLGKLVRAASMEEMYGWFADEPALVHRYLESACAQVAEAVEGMALDGLRPEFMMWAHEMLLPPWLGPRQFDEFVFPYDKRVNDVTHRHGGRQRIHSHGNGMDFLLKLADMGIDSLEPLERPPYGDYDLAEAKRLVGDRILLSGNIAVQEFVRAKPEDVRRQVREAIRAAAAGGGFTLRASASGPSLGAVVITEEDAEREFANFEAYILAGLEYGQYPIVL